MRPSPEAERLVATLFTREECDGLSASADRDLAFLRCWTLNEAVLEAVGRGLTIEPAAFNTGATPGTRPAELKIGDRRMTARVVSVYPETYLVPAIAQSVACSSAATRNEILLRSARSDFHPTGQNKVAIRNTKRIREEDSKTGGGRGRTTWTTRRERHMARIWNTATGECVCRLWRR
jgi:hypothetical protein